MQTVILVHNRQTTGTLHAAHGKEMHRFVVHTHQPCETCRLFRRYIVGMQLRTQRVKQAFCKSNNRRRDNLPSSDTIRENATKRIKKDQMKNWQSHCRIHPTRQWNAANKRIKDGFPPPRAAHDIRIRTETKRWQIYKDRRGSVAKG